MLKKTITYKDLDGNPITEDFYFNLSKSEIAKMELSQAGGSLSAYLTRIVEASDGGSIIKAFEEILSKSYGIRGVDNKSFEKSPEISRAFMQTEAYDVLFMELITDAEASAAFIRGAVPADLADKMDIPVLPAALAAVDEEPVRDITDVQLPQEQPKLSGVAQVMSGVDEPKQLSDMSREELIQAMRDKNTGN